MTLQRVLRITTALSTAVIIAASASAHAQEVASAATDTQETVKAADEPAADVVVVGVRGAVEKAADKKRNAKQIVDSVEAEDVGKLPDNNVPEAMARITGVQIDRARGQGQSVAIRGLDGVQTTVNGNNTNQGEGRSIDLSDIPAELLKSVEVYKTRSADQVEGSIAGTVNVELRRPFDLRKGWTLAGSFRGSYDDISEKVSPYASLLVANRFDTGIGEIGFLVNASYTDTKFRENFIESESPFGIDVGADTYYLPYRAQYGYEEGSTRRPSINAVLQWRASDKLDFVLEGGYIGSKQKRAYNRLYIQDMPFVGTYSNIALMPDGNTVRSLTITNASGLPAGIDNQYVESKSDLYTTNFEGHWRSDRVQLNVSAQYNWSKDSYYFVETILRPGNLTSATIDFASDVYAGGAPQITFNGVDLTDISRYGVDRFQDNQGGSQNREFAAQYDLTVQVSDTSLLRSIQVGSRYSQRKVSNFYGYRDGFPRLGGALVSASLFPGFSSAELVGPNLGGANTQWYAIPGSAVMSNVADVRAFIQQYDPGNADRFASVFPPSDRGQTFRSTEMNFASYAQINYGFGLGGLAVDGFAGVRYTNTWGRSTSFNFRPGDASNGFQDIVQEAPSRGNYADWLPSASAIIHFAPKMQLRLAYSTNVQRPSFYDMRPFYFAETRANPPVVYAGNPKLKAQRDYAFDVSAEYFFGRGGQISLAGYYKKASGFLLYSRQEASAAELLLYGINLADYGGATFGYVEQLRNVGDGKFAGLEGTVQTFFDFLPGPLKNFGVNLNASHILQGRVEYAPVESFPGEFDSLNTSKWTANATLFYDTPKFSTRLAYNYRSSYRLGIWLDREGSSKYSPYNAATDRLDAAMNFTPVPFMTLSLEASNILGSDVRRYHGSERLLPLGVRTLARTVQGSIRFRF